MSSKLQPVRGTHDILPDEFGKFNHVTKTARELAMLYGFLEMATPIFEQVDVFARSMGESSDVVSKEMFSFETRGGEAVALRPEFTAGIARSFISNGMQQHLPLKLFSTGQVFRYERPQKGRQRQFHQVNFEWLGDDSWFADVEMITLAGHLLYSLSDKKACTLLVNTLGDIEGRQVYRAKLVDYLTPYIAELSEDSKRRLEQNPLRILDSKDAGDRKILENAPKITDYLGKAAGERFDKICSALQNKNVPFFQEIKIEPSLVRGLDYYTDTVFEFVANTGELGAQNTVLAGGRYDGLIEQMGGRATPAIGFAAGVERLLLLADQGKFIDGREVKIFILPEESEETIVYTLATIVRSGLQEILCNEATNKKLSVEILWQGNLKKRMEKANKQAATHVILVRGNNYEIKNMATGEQMSISPAEFENRENIRKILGI